MRGSLVAIVAEEEIEELCGQLCNNCIPDEL